MIKPDRTYERLVALFLLGALLLLPPVLLVFNRPVRILGIPALYLYIFVTWAGLIAVAAFVASRIDATPAGPTAASDSRSNANSEKEESPRA